MTLLQPIKRLPWQGQLGFLLAVLSYVVLVPGLTTPIMTLTAELKMFGMSTQLLNETRSIWQTVTKLHHDGHSDVALMIVTFSMIIPIGKGLVMLWTLLFPSPLRWKIVAAISKWSMADVFVVAILVAFFAADAIAKVEADLQIGFYWFTGFCLLSVLSGQMLAYAGQKVHNAPAR